MISPARKLRFLRRYAVRWKKEIVLSLCSLVFVSATSLVFPWLLKLMVDRFGVPEAGTGEITILVVALVVLFLCSSLLGYYQQMTMNVLGFRLRNELRTDLYRTLLFRPLSFHRNQQVGELSSRATEDIGKVQHIFASLLAPVTHNLLIVTGGITLTFLLNPAASLVLLLFLVLPAPLVIRFSKRIRDLAARSQSQHAEANAHLEESLVAIREVKAMAREEDEVVRYNSFLDSAFGHEVQASRLIYRGTQSAYFLLSAMLLVMFYLSGVAAIPGWTLGSMVAFYFYAYTIAMALLSSGRIYLAYQNVAGALGRVQDLLEDRTTDQDLRDRKPAPSLNGRMRLQDVTFSYGESEPVLHNVTLEIHSGEWIVMSGPSGSGKSTIANLLMGFYNPQSGTVLFDGIDIRSLYLPSLRRQIGYVGQDPFLFHGTVLDNLRLGSRVDPSEVDKVLHTACLTELITDLPEALQTVVGERGYTLSGGQKARLAVARALLSGPPILILDEANAMLEADLESRLWKNLTETRKNLTTIVFSHHIDLIPRIDRFFLIRQGRVFEEAPAGVRVHRP